MNDDKKDTINILADMRRKSEDRITANRNATFFVAFGYMVGFMLLMYMQQMQILAYISIFVFALFAIVYKDYRTSQKDIEDIDALYLEYEFKRKNK
jgi:hypothetical protein